MNSTPENMETASAKGKLTLEFQLHKRLQHKVGEAIADFALLQEGDRVLIGLSGGKDSLALLDLLGERQQRARDAWQLHALHVRMRNIHYRTDTAYLAERCAAWGIPLHVVEAGFEPDRNARRTPCFLCSWNRRKVLFQQAQALGCNKIALGHHQDDILRTALMNLTFNGSFATMPVRIAMRKFPLTIVRPLALIAEDELRQWAACRGYRPVDKVCPHDKESNRTHVEQLTDAMQRLNPDYRHHLWHALLKAGALVEE